MILAATGHRPEKLGGYAERTRWRLIMLAVDYISDANPDRIICGMALGWDQAVAEAAVECGIPFVAAVPFRGQEHKWPLARQRHYDRLLSAAETVEVISPYADSTPYQHRNEWMVDRASKIVALWDGSWGGTFNCVRYAEKRRVPVDNLWSRWDSDLREMLY